MSNEIQEIDAIASDLRKYRIELPNLLDDSGLHPFAFRLLAHYYRRRVCWESIETTAKICKMAVGSVVKHRRALEQGGWIHTCLLYTSPSPRDGLLSRMPSSA